MTHLPSPAGWSGERIERTASVTFEQSFLRNPLSWALRCYGRGVCTIAEGRRSRYATEDAARQAAATWIATGVSPADQQPYGARPAVVERFLIEGTL